MNELRRFADPTLLVVAAVYGLALVLAGFAGLFGIPLAMLVLLSICRYGYEVLRTAAQGHSHLPAPAIETMNPLGELPQVLHFVFFMSLGWLLANPPVAPGSLLAMGARFGLVAVLLAFPASAALLAMTYSLGAALDPRRMVSLIGEMGRRYAAIPAIAVVSGLLAAVLDRAGLGILAEPAAVFSLLAVFFATGLVLRSARDVIDIPGEREPAEEYAERMQRRDWQTQLDVAYASIRSGLIEQGYRTIRVLLESADSNDAAHRWVIGEMLGWEDRSHARVVGVSYVERLLETGRTHAALELAAQLRDDTDRIAVSGSAAASLADYAQSIGRYRLADELRETFVDPLAIDVDQAERRPLVGAPRSNAPTGRRDIAIDPASRAESDRGPGSG